MSNDVSIGVSPLFLNVPATMFATWLDRRIETYARAISGYDSLGVEADTWSNMSSLEGLDPFRDVGWIYQVDLTTHPREPGSGDYDHIRFLVTPLGRERVEVIAGCIPPELSPYLLALLTSIAQRWPETVEQLEAQGIITEESTDDGDSGKRGTHGGTLARVREAKELVDKGATKTEACSRAHTDPRTYDRYLPQLLDEDGDWGVEPMYWQR